MPNPRSRTGRLASNVFHRRPSAAMVVALLALFLAAGGASYAATALPSNSVGTNQLQNNAVTNHKIRDNAVGNHKIQNNAVGFRKIQAGAIGAQRVNKGAVQLRVGGTCTAGGQAITAIQNTGKVTCGATTPASFNGGQSDPVTITSSSAASATQITGISLAAGSSYVVMANPQISVSAADQAFGHVVVSCTLSVAGSATATQTRTQSFDLGFGQTSPANNGAQAASRSQSNVIPLMVSAASSTSAAGAAVTCNRTLTGTQLGTPTVTAAGTITALQTSSNSTLQSTVNTPPAPPAPTNPPTNSTSGS